MLSLRLRITVAFVIACCSLSAAAHAEGLDVITLKNGGFVRGQVLEHDPATGTTVLLADGTKKTYAAAEVASVKLAGASASAGEGAAAAGESSASAPAGAPPAKPEPAPWVTPKDAPEPERTAHNALFIELGGNGVAYSVNYERHLMEELTVRAGVGVWGFSFQGSGVFLATIPVTASYLVGSPSHKFELGGGVTGVVYSGNTTGTGAFEQSGIIGTAIAGYRYNPPQKAFFFKGAFTPLFGSFGFIPSIGVSLGVGF